MTIKGTTISCLFWFGLMESTCLYHHYCSLDEPITCWQRYEPVENPTRYVKSTLYSLSYLTAANTSVILERTVTARCLSTQVISSSIYNSTIYQFAYDLSVLSFINNKELFRLDSNIIMALTTRDLEILSAAFQCLRDPDAFKVGQLIAMTGASCHSISLSITIHLKLCLLLWTHPSYCLLLFISNCVFYSEHTYLNPSPCL